MNKVMARILCGMIPFRGLRRTLRYNLITNSSRYASLVNMLPEEAINLPLVDKIRAIEQVRELLLVLTPFDAVGVKKLRIGGNGDGGYVMLDPGRDGLALSMGISSFAPWDMAMAERNFTVHQYDGTIADHPENHPNIHFHRQNIDGLRFILQQSGDKRRHTLAGNVIAFGFWLKAALRHDVI